MSPCKKYIQINILQSIQTYISSPFIASLLMFHNLFIFISYRTTKKDMIYTFKSSFECLLFFFDTCTPILFSFFTLFYDYKQNKTKKKIHKNILKKKKMMKTNLYDVNWISEESV